MLILSPIPHIHLKTKQANSSLVIKSDTGREKRGILTTKRYEGQFCGDGNILFLYLDLNGNYIVKTHQTEHLICAIYCMLYKSQLFCFYGAGGQTQGPTHARLITLPLSILS